MVLSLSSLDSAANRKMTLDLLAEGDPAIVVGTHALLSKKVSIPNLGLAIIDEEHRFGVMQKERVREMRASVDVLAMSATPIPRTLSMAMEGLRELSLIATPPPDRLDVRTFVYEDYDSIVSEGLSRELARGGQVFFIYHRVQTLSTAEERLRELAPNARIGIAHGQLPHVELESVMRGFYRGEIDILLCTSIVESGIDVPNANTIIVPRSEHFGLAELHQLRGRVGRSARQGYAYFLTTPKSYDRKKDTSNVEKRLSTLVESLEHGGGYYIAQRDLEIRGAGELLGKEQSGVITGIGMEAFRRMLNVAARSIGLTSFAGECELDLGGHARLPERYCPDAVERMRCYRLLSSFQDEDEIERFRDLLADRFGPLPSQAQLLIDSHHLRLKAVDLGVESIKANSHGLNVRFLEDSRHLEKLGKMAKRKPDCELLPGNTLRISGDGDIYARVSRATQACEELIEAGQKVS